MFGDLLLVPVGEGPLKRLWLLKRLGRVVNVAVLAKALHPVHLRHLFLVKHRVNLPQLFFIYLVSMGLVLLLAMKLEVLKLPKFFVQIDLLLEDIEDRLSLLAQYLLVKAGVDLLPAGHVWFLLVELCGGQVADEVIIPLLLVIVR